jgi:HEAT repeat protein
MARLFFYVVSTVCVLVAGSAAQCPVALADMGQNADTVISQAGNLTSVTDMLTEMSIPLMNDCLLTALHSENREVRKLVATEAAAKNIKEAIPAIAQLLAGETEPYSRIQLAEDLTVLGDQRGTQTLESYCSNVAEPIWARLRAAHVLEVDLKQESCPEVIAAALNEREATYRVEALRLIPYSIDLSAKAFLQLHMLLLKSLSDPDRSVRITAARTIAMMGDVSAIPALQTASAGESDPDVRNALSAGVKSLQSKQP